MEIAQLIHSRTFYCDFNQNFAARPKDLNVQWAMNKILPSTRDIDILNGVRRVVATDGKICIAGISCNFKSFAENICPPPNTRKPKNISMTNAAGKLKFFSAMLSKGAAFPMFPIQSFGKCSSKL